MATTRDPTDLRSLDDEEAARADKSAEERRQEIGDFKWLLAHKQGRRIVWRYLGVTGVYRTSFTGNSTTFFNEGRRDVGLMLLAELHEANPDAYVLMLKEHNK